MGEYRGFNFGPILGPNKGIGATSSGRWLHIYRPASPLAPGRNEWVWIDGAEGGFGGGGIDPDPGGWSGGGGSGGKGGGGGGRGGVHLGPTWVLAPDSLYGQPGQSGPTCSKEQQKAILEAYERVMASPKWRDLLSQFEGLLGCMVLKWDGVRITCTSMQMRDNPVLGFDPDRRFLTFAYGDLDAASPDWLELRLVQQLVYACGGDIFEAYAITGRYCNCLFKEVASNLAKQSMKRGAEVFETPDGPYIEGQWLRWDPKVGEIRLLKNGAIFFPDPMYDNRNPAQLRKLRQWFQLR